MHRALLIPEVLLDIFAHLNPWLLAPHEVSLDRKSLVALATTCKTFHEPAMDLLWAEVQYLEPLLGSVTRLHPMIYSGHPLWKSLIYHTWADLQDFKPLSANETCQFLRHSARVRSLMIPRHDRLVHFLSDIPIETCVFPRLQSLVWLVSTAKYMDLFLTHTLRQCHLWTINEGLQSLVTRCSALEDLAIYNFHPSAANELSLLSDSVCLCKHLVNLSCPPLNWAAWEHLSNLPTLLRVEIDTKGKAFPWLLERNIVHFSPFRNVTALSLLLPSAAYIIAVMEHSQFPSLLSFTADLEVPSQEVAEKLIHALSQCTTSQILEKIVITFDDYPYDDQDPPPPGSLTMIPHFLCFTQLQTLQLHFDGDTILLDNDILLEAMSTWPHIHSLQITHWNLRPSPVTFRGLFTAIRLCPHLHHLQIAIDTENIDIDPDAEPIPHTSLRILELETAESPVGDPEAVASIIFDWLPCIVEVSMSVGGMEDVNSYLGSLRAAALDAAEAVS